MVKQAFVVVGLSILVILGLHEFTTFLHKLWASYEFLIRKLDMIFAGSHLADIIRQTIALILIPVLLAAIPALAYYFATRKKMPYLVQTIGLAWVLTTATVALHSYPSA